MSPYQVPRSHSPRSGLLIVAVMLLGIQGCQNPPTRQDTGMVIGGVLAYFTLQIAESLVTPLLALAAASMLYVAVADLIPGLHRRPELAATAQQVVLIGLGIATIGAIGSWAHGH